MTSSSREAAVLEFLRSFPTISNAPVELADLHDGVTLFEALSELAPDYFDPTTIGRHLGDNWALKSSNLRKLVRNLEQYYREELKKDSDMAALNLTNIARTRDVSAIMELVEYVAAAAVTCSNKSEYVSRIMNMSPEGQVEMKQIIQTSLGRLNDYERDVSESEAQNSDEDDENELVFGKADSMIQDEGDEDGSSDPDNHSPPNRNHHSKALFGGNSLNEQELQQQVESLTREVASVKSQAAFQQEDAENALAKLRALADDLQDRLVSRQDDLIQVEEDLARVNSELEDTKAKLADALSQKAQLADDLDVANAKSHQLHRAEATLVTYKKKLEAAGLMTQQMNELEDQAAKYVRQIVDLEAEVKKSNALQKTVTELQEKLARLERAKIDTDSSSKSSAEVIADLKSQLSAVESAKKMYEHELNELRAQQEQAVHQEEVPVTSPMYALSLNNEATPSKSDKEKIMRLQAENDKLLEEIAELKKVSTAVPSVSASIGADAGAAADLNNEIARLKEVVALKTKENAKISMDKDKLEAYTKRTLAKFQDKYLVALQECKAKLKEKQDKIEALENRSQSERTAQKREERLLSSTIYELGMSIMQNRLKER